MRDGPLSVKVASPSIGMKTGTRRASSSIGMKTGTRHFSPGSELGDDKTGTRRFSLGSELGDDETNLAKDSCDTQRPLDHLKLYSGEPAAFGALRIPGSKREYAKWMACSSTSSVDRVFDVMVDVWKLERPTVLISVTGAASGTVDQLQPLQKAIFRRGLREAARQTKGWIITGGTNAGVMKLVGTTVRESDDPLVCVGVATLGSIDRHEDMLRAKPRSVFSYERECAYDEEDERMSNMSGTSSRPQQTRTSLDPNHSHFILVDDGTTDKFGGEIEFRSKLEDRICKEEGPASASVEDSVLPTPMVLIVVGGGLGTLQTIFQSLTNERPCVILADSGGAAGDIYEYYRFNKLSDSKTMRRLEKKEDRRLYRKLIEEICKRGRAKHGANKAEQMRFFHSSQAMSEEKELNVMILEAILADCDNTVDAIMHGMSSQRSTPVGHTAQPLTRPTARRCARVTRVCRLVGAHSSAFGRFSLVC